MPSFPYAGSSGWSGSTASRQRAFDEDSNGTTSDRQARVLDYLYSIGKPGATWLDIASKFGWHHGQASGVLSVLHKTGEVARLKERRNKCSVYVVPEFIGERITSEHGRKRACPHCGGAI